MEWLCLGPNPGSLASKVDACYHQTVQVVYKSAQHPQRPACCPEVLALGIVWLWDFRVVWHWALGRPGHAGVRGNERAGRLASTTKITSGLQLGRAEVLRTLRNFLNMDRPEYHNIDRLKERGMEKGSGRRSTLRGRERSVFNQTSIGTVSRATYGRLLRDGAESFRALRWHLKRKLELYHHCTQSHLTDKRAFLENKQVNGLDEDKKWTETQAHCRNRNDCGRKHCESSNLKLIQPLWLTEELRPKRQRKRKAIQSDTFDTTRRTVAHLRCS